MTCIEFFDKEPIENVCTCFATEIDRVIFIGKDKKVMERFASRIDKLFRDRKTMIQFEVVCANTMNLADVVNKITQIIEERKENESFVFDLTGGDDLCLVAMGIVFERFKNCGIQMHRYNLRNNKIMDCDADGNLIAENDIPKISVEETIRLFGGDIIYGSIDDDKHCFKWDMNDEFAEDIEAMWIIHGQIYSKKGDLSDWNNQMMIFAAIEKCGSVDGLTTNAKKRTLEKNLIIEEDKDIISNLRKYKLINIKENNESISITYKNEQVKRCLTKAGQVLEMIVFLYALQACDKNNMPVYNDVLNGVYIDWDGDLQTEQDDVNTENEIDVIAMHGSIPVFISCKNGAVEKIELYKLNSVATRFGGKYARKMLVATSLGESESASYLRQRAKDMQIDVLEPMCLTDNEFKKRINQAWSNAARRKV